MAKQQGQESAADELVIFQEAVFEDVEPTAMEADQTLVEGFGDEMSFDQEMEACWSFGPLRVCGSVVGVGVKVTGSLFGRTILSGTLSTRKTKLCASPNIGIGKAELCVSLDVGRDRVRVEGKLCIRKWTGGWRCSNFGSNLLSW